MFALLWNWKHDEVMRARDDARDEQATRSQVGSECLCDTCVFQMILAECLDEAGSSTTAREHLS